VKPCFRGACPTASIASKTQRARHDPRARVVRADVASGHGRARLTLVGLLHRLRSARDRRSAAGDRSAEFAEANREIDDVTARIWALDEEELQDHDVALTVARLRAVQATLTADADDTEAALVAARHTIAKARALLRRSVESADTDA
jgi:hypothetical protein